MQINRLAEGKINQIEEEDNLYKVGVFKKQIKLGLKKKKPSNDEIKDLFKNVINL